MRPLLPPLAALALFAFAGCRSASHNSDAMANPYPNGNSAIVIDGDQLRSGETVLYSLQGRLSSLQVRRSLRNSCPEVFLRGRQSIMGSNDPTIYVDGARATNTCVLEEIGALDISRVEVYPMGVRSGYASDPNGLILIFLLTGHDG